PGTTVPMPPLRETDTLDFPQIAGWGQTRGDRSRFVSPSTLTVGVLALLFGLLVAVSAIVVPLFLRGGAQVVARPQSLDPPMALQARGACDGFFKAKTTLTWLSTTSSFADGYAVYRSTSHDGPFFRVELLPGRTSASCVAGSIPAGGTKTAVEFPWAIWGVLHPQGHDQHDGLSRPRRWRLTTQTRGERKWERSS